MTEIKQPKIRFKGHISDWEHCKLGDLGSVAMNKRIFKEETSDSGEIPFYKIGTFGGEPDAYISRELYKEYKEKYPYPKIGDILISASGSIGRTKVYLGEDAYFQDSNIVWLNHDGRISNSFLVQFYSFVKWKGLEGSTIKRLYNKTILDTDISIPNLDEQTKIGEFFKTLDDTIALHQQKLEVTKQFKQTMLKKMFPKNGETTPEIRFKGFTDDWKEEKLGNLIKLNKSQEVKRENLTNIRNGYYVLGMRTFSKDGYLDKSKDFWYNLPVEDNPDLFLNIGEFAMIDADMDSELSKIGKVLMNASDEKYLLNSHICKVSLKNENDYNYLFSVMSTPYTNKLLKKEANGSIAKGILNKDVYKQKVLVTEDKKEQELIGDFFYQLEKEIYLIEQKLETYKSFKKAMLQKMFI